VLSQRHSPSILDLGCGTGIVALEVAASARFVIGVDISSSMILRAREKSIPCSTFIVADAFALPIKDSTIDTVMSRGVLISHYGRRHAENFFNEVARVIIPGGIFIIDYLHAGGRKFFPYETVYKTYFNKEYISILADRTGFALGQIDGGEISRVHIIELVKL
jgi:ubiquinone/menaquinone biosynthesis C-methylase UbiE